jgi:tRNA1(Val) A37 N6-methylase TrmN6
MERTDILEGKIACFQPVDGYRFAVDSLLLPWFITSSPGISSRVCAVELGSGSGVMSALTLKLGLFSHVHAIELQEQFFNASQQTCQVNLLGDRMTCLHKDLRELTRADLTPSPGAVFSNPPFHQLDKGRVPPDLGRAMARHEVSVTMDDILARSRSLLPVGGRLYLTYPTTRLWDIMRALPDHGFQPLRLQLVHPRLDRCANRFLVEACRGQGRGMEVMPPLEIHGEDGGYGEWYQSLLKALER